MRREIEAHLEERAREFEARGLDPAAARHAALEAFGNRDAIETEVRALRGGTVRRYRRRLWWEELRQDLATAVRGLVRSPLFTAVALLTLALGIGANAAAFGVLRSVILQPLPYPESDRLVQVWTDHRARGRAEPEWLSPPQYFAVRDAVPAFEAVAAYQDWAPTLTGDGEPEALAGGSVAAGFLDLLKAPPVLGRGFQPADDLETAEPVVVLSDALWRRRFASDPGIIGRPIQLSGVSWTVIGVMAPDFRPPRAWEILRPIRRPAASTCNHGCITLRALARLAPGATLDQAREQVGAALTRLVAESPAENERIGPWLVPLHEQIVGPVRPALIALSGAVGFVLLIACVNLASLTMVRSAARAREFGVRAALGAGRGRIVRQLLTESLLLAALGGALGAWVGMLGTGLLAGLVPPAIRDVQAIRLDGPAFAFTLVVTAVVGVLFGLLPALQGARTDLMGVLRSTHPDGGRRITRTRRGLVVTQLAIASVLLVGAGLLMQTFLHLQRTDLGFRAERIITARINYTPARYPEMASVATAIEALLERLRAHPAVAAAEVSSAPPLTPGGDSDITALADGVPPAPGTEAKTLWYRAVSPGALRTLGTRLVAGRALGPEDRPDAPLATILTESAARRLWPEQDPIGRYFTTSASPDANRFMVVGVVADIRHQGPREPAQDQVFISYAQTPVRVVTILLDPAGSETEAIAALRGVLRDADPQMPLAALGSLRDRVQGAIAMPRHFATIVGGFALAAVALALTGVYGLMAYTVALRQREIGVRLALGAAPERVLAWLVGEGARLAIVGVVFGVGLAMASTRVLRANLHGVGTMDAATFVAVPLLIGLAALGACWVPARRARTVDPSTALRAE